MTQAKLLPGTYGHEKSRVDGAVLLAKGRFTEDHKALILSLENDSYPGFPKKEGCVCVCGMLAHIYGVCFVLCV